jgi:hypothetical protein
MLRSSCRRPFLKTLLEESAKIVPYATHVGSKNATEATQTLKESVAHVTSVAKGVDGKSQDELEKEAKKKEAVDKYNSDMHRAAVEAQAIEWERIKDLPLYTRVGLRLQTTWESLRHATSTQAAVVALVERCAVSHAADVAVEQGIDVRSVTMNVEKASVGEGDKVVGYIEAPNATDEEVYAFAAKLQKSCPAARLHNDIVWRRK